MPVMSSLIGRSIDNVIGSVDVDGIISRIDVDQIASRIDWNKVLDSVDMDRQIARIDVNAILDRVDMDKLVERSNLEAIVARSSSGILQQLVDLIRIHIVKLDMFVHRLSRCTCMQKDIYLPPRPEPRRDSVERNGSGRRPGLEMTAASRHMAIRVVEVQGAYCGVVSRLSAWLIDEGVAWFSFAVITLLIESVTQVIKRDNDFKIDAALLVVVYVAWSIQIRLLSLLFTRRTIGMALMGLVLVNRNGQRPSPWQIVLRQVIQPVFSMIPVVNWASFALAWCRSDGRFAHDLLACTGCVYCWDVRMSKLRLSRNGLDGKETGDDPDEDFNGDIYP